MWMRCCAACRRVLRKPWLCDHIRCDCGWVECCKCSSEWMRIFRAPLDLEKYLDSPRSFREDLKPNAF